ncbi:hypothetical protein [uncultured Sphingomonas sp.]|uniref:hypothetical protein n=1 Tax=uncultured Sphingomonas sp. TaxID=158754 RepID=UPI0025F272CE|nr:hypothetical protein [uncultured Sphingomonas sp.]
MAGNDTAPVHRDNPLGICHAPGETFDADPLLFRLAPIVGLLLSAKLTSIAYVTAGITVLIATFCTRERRSAPAAGA